MDFLRATYSEVSEALQRALGVQGPLADAIDGAMQVGITGLDLRDPDMLWLRRQTRFASGQNLAGVAAQWPIFEFENPAGSEIIMTVRTKVMNPTTAGILCHFAVTTQLIGGGPATRSTNLDSRQAFDAAVVAPRPVAIVRAQSLAAPAPINGPVYYVPPNGAATDLPVIVLTKGNTIRVQSNPQNTPLGVLFEWTERQQQPMES